MCEQIAYSAALAAFGKQEAGPGRIGFQLTTQAVDRHLEQVMLACVLISPDELEQQFLGYYLPCIPR